MSALESFLTEVAEEIGADEISRSDETIERYGENTLPGGDRRPAAVVYPGSTAEVQAIVRAANRHKVALYPNSTGANIGLGTRCANHAGQVVVDMGKRMNRILEVNEKLG